MPTTESRPKSGQSVNEDVPFKQLVNARYWAASHDEKPKNAKRWVDKITGLCQCCGVNYHRVRITRHLDLLAHRYPNDVLIRALHAEAHENGEACVLTDEEVADLERRDAWNRRYRPVGH